MAWSASKIFTAFLEDALNNDTAFALDTDTFKAALYNNTTAPDQTVAAAASAYDTGVWVTANEVDDPTDWATAGEPITGTDWVAAANVLTFDGVDTPQNGASCTLADVYGCLVYDDDMTDKGVCFNYFGGVNAVTAGNFTVIWHGSGIFAITA